MMEQKCQQPLVKFACRILNFTTRLIENHIYIQGVFFNWSYPKSSKCQSVSKFWHLELFWWDLLCNLILRTFWVGPVKKNTLYDQAILFDLFTGRVFVIPTSHVRGHYCSSVSLQCTRLYPSNFLCMILHIFSRLFQGYLECFPPSQAYEQWVHQSWETLQSTSTASFSRGKWYPCIALWCKGGHHNSQDTSKQVQNYTGLG